MAKKKTKKKSSISKNRQEYNKQVARIKRRIREIGKRGFEFTQQAVEKLIPKAPQKVTKQAIQKLKEITPEKIYSQKGVVYKTETGSYVSGIAGRRIEARKAAIKAAQTRYERKQRQYESFEDEYEPFTGEWEHDYTDYDWENDTPPYESDEVLLNFIDMLAKYEPDPSWHKDLIEKHNQYHTTVLTVLNSAITRDGRRAVARRLELNSDVILSDLEYVLYGQSKGYANWSESNVRLTRIVAIINGRLLTPEESADISDLEDYIED